MVASERSTAFDDPGVFVEIPLVNQIRPRVQAWREAGYPGVTGITKRLLEHWNDPEEFESRRFFFCQLEAIETLIWLTEAPAAEKVGIEIPGRRRARSRACARRWRQAPARPSSWRWSIAWHILNKVTYPQDARFSKNVLVVAPGLTVKSRLAVLEPAAPGNYYEAFRIVPAALLDKLRQGRVIVRNWHALNWETEEQIAKKRSVDKRGAKSDEAYVREVLGEMADARNILVINDEAHHAWRVPAGIEGQEASPKEDRRGGDQMGRRPGPASPRPGHSQLLRLLRHALRAVGQEELRGGPVRLDRERFRPQRCDRGRAGQDAARGRARRRRAGREDLQVASLPHLQRPRGEGRPQPQGRAGGAAARPGDRTPTTCSAMTGGRPRRRGAGAGLTTPPVMITVANRTETAARIKYAFDHSEMRIDELCDPERTLHIDSKVLEEAEAAEEPVAALASAEMTRTKTRTTRPASAS